MVLGHRPCCSFRNSQAFAAFAGVANRWDTECTWAAGEATSTARTLATTWCAGLPVATSARIAAKTFPAKLTDQGARCDNWAGCAAPPNGSSFGTPLDRFCTAARKVGHALPGGCDVRLAYSCANVPFAVSATSPWAI